MFCGPSSHRSEAQEELPIVQNHETKLLLGDHAKTQSAEGSNILVIHPLALIWLC